LTLFSAINQDDKKQITKAALRKYFSGTDRVIFSETNTEAMADDNTYNVTDSLF